MRLEPELAGSRYWIEGGLAPPLGFIAVSVELVVMSAAERDGELVADLAAECAALCEA